MLRQMQNCWFMFSSTQYYRLMEFYFIFLLEIFILFTLTSFPMTQSENNNLMVTTLNDFIEIHVIYKYQNSLNMTTSVSFITMHHLLFGRRAVRVSSWEISRCWREACVLTMKLSDVYSPHLCCRSNGICAWNFIICFPGRGKWSAL